MKRIKTQLGILIALFACVLFPVRSVAWPVYGDVSGGGVVAIDDVTYLIDHMLSGETTIMDDVDGNLEINIKDLVMLIDYLLHRPDWEWTFDLYYPPVPDSAMVVTVNGVSFAMMPVKGGVHYPHHDEGGNSVILSDFYIGMTEVTAGLWEAVMGKPTSAPMGYKAKPNEAANFVSWWECKEFIAKLNQLTGLEFQMPTIDQWTYAASGGKWTHDYTYSGSNDLDEVAWYDGNRLEIYERYLQIFPNHSYSMPVGMKKPNELGIYDMSGNMMEQLEYSYTGWGERYEELDPEESNLHTTNLAGGGLFEGMWYCEIYHGYWTTHSPNDSRRDAGLRLLLMASSLDK